MGFYLRAIKDSERAARSLGAPASRTKLYAFMLSAGLTSVAGALYAMMFGFVDPESGLGILISVKILIMAALGGAGCCSGRWSGRRSWCRWRKSPTICSAARARASPSSSTAPSS